MWLVTCEGNTLARWPRLFLLIASLTQKCLLLFPRVLVDSSHPEMDVATARNANFRTILARRLERGPHRSRLNEAHNLHLPLEHPRCSRSRPGRSANVTPRNVCDFYWNTGQCNRGFDCTFKHQKNTPSGSDTTNTAGRTDDDEDAANAALEFFTTDNLAQIAGVGLHSSQEGTPENAHNSIKRYLTGGPLNNPADMKPFVSVLASVNRRNRTWVRVILQSASDGH